MQPSSLAIPILSHKFSFVRLLGCASAVAWYAFISLYSESADEDRQRVAKIGACIVFLEFVQDNRRPRPLGRLVNIFKLFVYFWWLHVASHLCLAIWSTLGSAIDKQERASFAVNALNFLILVKIWSQIEYMHQSFSDVFSRFNLKAGVLVSGTLSLIGIYLSNSIAASSLVANSCDLGGSVLSNLFCHSSQPKSMVLLLFAAALGIYYIFLYQSYKRTGKGFLPKDALINADPSCLRAGDMVLTPLFVEPNICAVDNVPIRSPFVTFLQIVESGALGNLAHEAVVHAELVLKNPDGQLMLFSSTMRAGARLAVPARRSRIHKSNTYVQA